MTEGQMVSSSLPLIQKGGERRLISSSITSGKRLVASSCLCRRGPVTVSVSVLAADHLGIRGERPVMGIRQTGGLREPMPQASTDESMGDRTNTLAYAVQTTYRSNDVRITDSWWTDTRITVEGEPPETVGRIIGYENTRSGETYELDRWYDVIVNVENMGDTKQRVLAWAFQPTGTEAKARSREVTLAPGETEEVAFQERWYGIHSSPRSFIHELYGASEDPSSTDKIRREPSATLRPDAKLMEQASKTCILPGCPIPGLYGAGVLVAMGAGGWVVHRKGLGR